MAASTPEPSTRVIMMTRPGRRGGARRICARIEVTVPPKKQPLNSASPADPAP
jgi:hypothetical protein